MVTQARNEIREMSKALVGDQTFLLFVPEYTYEVHGHRHQSAPLGRGHGRVLLACTAETACNELASCTFHGRRTAPRRPTLKEEGSRAMSRPSSTPSEEEAGGRAGPGGWRRLMAAGARVLWGGAAWIRGVAGGPSRPGDGGKAARDSRCGRTAAPLGLNRVGSPSILHTPAAYGTLWHPRRIL